MKSVIKHVIVLMLENRSFDHLFGWASELLKVNGLKGTESNPISTKSPDSGSVTVTKNAPYINVCGPTHNFPDTTAKIFGKNQVDAGNLANETMAGFVENEGKHKSHCGVMDMFDPEKLPIITTLAQEFAVMDRFFAAMPGPTWPNRQFTIAATSAGQTETGTWYRNEPGKLFPQRTIFDQVEEAGLTWRNYYNDTPWELFMEKMAFSHDEVRPLHEFYSDAAAGTLPSYAWINPASGMDLETGLGSNDQHPDHDMRLGEALIKDIYEALRASPQWNETLFVLTYDEHGGFYDHVLPPSVDIPPPGDGESSYPGDFAFDRLGIRIPTLLVSPWIPKGTVISEPPEDMKPAANSEYDLTSIMASARRLLGMPETPLTQRDAWSATFDHVISDTFRDSPAKLPDAPMPEPADIAREAEEPINDLQGDLVSALARLEGFDEVPAMERQAELRTFMDKAWTSYRERVRRWRTPTNLTVEIQPLKKNNFKEKKWDIASSQLVGTERMIISTHDLRISEDALCLEAEALEPGATVVARPCLPSTNPDLNALNTQHWAWSGDATFRPARAPELCLAAHLFGPGEISKKVTLETCNEDFSQHWAYHGGYPGQTYSGTLDFGDYLTGLGLTSSPEDSAPALSV